MISWIFGVKCMIKHIKCDVLESGADVILHQVNCSGAMNSGVAKQVRQKWPWVYGQYMYACRTATKERLLGCAQTVFINEKQAVVNLFAQKDYGYDGKCYTDYKALGEALSLVNKHFHGKTIAIPFKMSCCRGGGDWNVVYKMIEETFTDNDVLICEYDRG